MKIEKLKPIPKEIVKKIENIDYKFYAACSGVRIYSYLTTINKEVVKVTVAAKMYKEQLLLKQVAVHGVNSEECWVKDMEYCSLGMGYTFWWKDLNVGADKWYGDKGWCSAEAKYYNAYSYLVNISFLGKTKYRYCGYQNFKGRCIITYLKLYEQYPQIEYLMKADLQHLAYRKMLLKKMKKDKAFCKWILENKDEIKDKYYSSDILIRAYNQHKPLTYVQKYENKRKEFMQSYTCNELKAMLHKNEYEKFFNYLEQQGTSISSYNDYLKACTFLQLDMNEDKNRYPHDFRYWHDVRIDEYHKAKAIADEEKRQELYAQFAIVADKYTPLERNKEPYIAVIAKSPADLITEGDALNHCVGRMNYDQKFVREETLIFFIRNRETPDTPLVTVEYSLKNHKVLQCYGYHDTKPQEEILNFVNKTWLPYANRKIKKIAA